ncbi:MAG: hypothetical protein Kow00109_01690 [Acidobacteriota bacterium]
MRLLALADLQERFEHLDRIGEVVENAHCDGILFAGNILAAEARIKEWQQAAAEHRRPSLEKAEVAAERSNDAESLARFFGVLHRLGVPVYVVPGKHDAPERFYLQALAALETVDPRVHQVHRSFAPLHSNYYVIGFGGAVTDNHRDNEYFLEYPAWEAEFGLDFVRHLDGDRILVFHTPPFGRIEDESQDYGHHVIETLIKSFDPRIAVCSRPSGRRGKQLIADTLVVYPGRLAEGEYAVIDTKSRTVEFGNLR